jgi:membrane protein implicated in regulation of membrane protease activity
MNSLRLLVLIAAAIASLATIAANFTTALPIVILGIPTITLPVGVWLVLFAWGAFAVASVVLWAIDLPRQILAKRLRRSQFPREEFSYRGKVDPPVAAAKDDDWEDEDLAKKERDAVPPEPPSEKYRVREDIVGSYSANRSPVAVDRTPPPVYDADFRVIAPPLRTPIGEESMPEEPIDDEPPEDSDPVVTPLTDPTPSTPSGDRDPEEDWDAVFKM